MPNLLCEVTSFGAWQKTWQKKTAEECQIVQEIAGHRNEKTPENAAKHGVCPAYTHIPIELRGPDCNYFHNKTLEPTQNVSGRNLRLFCPIAVTATVLNTP